jgi:acetoin utilization deacetylase AcuC-like enzyme
MHAIHNLMAIVDQFAPDVLAVSVGFDAYKDDPLLQLGVSATTYYEIGKLLKGKFNNIFAVLEGGYNTDYLPKCAFNFLAGINGDKIFYEDERTRSAPAVIKEYERRIAQLVGCLMPYWQVKDVGINIM